MKAGLDYQLDATRPMPADGALYEYLLPRALYLARKMKLSDPEGAASDACSEVIVCRRYQDRFRPGKATVESYLYTMVHNRLRDAHRSEYRRRNHENVWLLGHIVDRADRSASTLIRDEFEVDPGEADVGSLDPRFSEVETLADLEAMRQRIAGHEDPFFSELLDAMASRALANEPISQESLGLGLGVSRPTVKKRSEALRELAEGCLG